MAARKLKAAKAREEKDRSRAGRAAVAAEVAMAAGAAGAVATTAVAAVAAARRTSPASGDDGFEPAARVMASWPGWRAAGASALASAGAPATSPRSRRAWTSTPRTSSARRGKLWRRRASEAVGCATESHRGPHRRRGRPPRGVQRAERRRVHRRPRLAHPQPSTKRPPGSFREEVAFRSERNAAARDADPARKAVPARTTTARTTTEWTGRRETSPAALAVRFSRCHRRSPPLHVRRRSVARARGSVRGARRIVRRLFAAPDALEEAGAGADMDPEDVFEILRAPQMDESRRYRGEKHAPRGARRRSSARRCSSRCRGSCQLGATQYMATLGFS